MKVLYFVDNLEIGGIQRLLEKWVYNLIKKEIDVEFLILDDKKESSIENNLIKKGINIHKITNVNFNNPFVFIIYGRKLNNFFKKHNDYDVVHIHTSSKNYQVLKYAKKNNIPVRIIHSHSSNFKTKNIIKKIVGNIFKRSLKKYATHFFACSDSAGKWLYDRKILNSNRFYLIKNSIDCNQFKINNKIRNKIRKELQVNDNTIVFGQIGRLVEVKNHKFSIDMFEGYNRYNMNSKLIFLGDGELKSSLQKKISDKKLSNKVILKGNVDNVNEYLQAIDILLLPSLYEGLPMILVEAQASGTKCLVSNNVSKESKITDDVFFISINDVNDWIKMSKKIDINKNNNIKKIIDNGFSIEDSIEKLIEIYKG